MDGEDKPELLVAYGERIFAFDGDTGISANIGTDGLLTLMYLTELGHHLIADMDGDGYLDLLVGDVLISESKPDVRR